MSSSVLICPITRLEGIEYDAFVFGHVNRYLEIDQSQNKMHRTSFAAARWP